MWRAYKIAPRQKSEPSPGKASYKKADDEAQVPAEGWFTLSDALLIAAVTALAYFYSFLYERGLLRAHGISTDFIEVSVGTVLLAVATMGAVIVFPLFFYPIVRPSITPTVSIVLRAGKQFFGLLAGAIFLAASLGWTWGVISVWAFVVILFLHTYVRPLVDRKGSYLERLRSDAKAERATTLKMIEPYLRVFGYRYWNLLLFLVFLMPVSLYLGETSVKRQKTYPTFAYQGRAWAIVRAYGDRWIVREFNYSTGLFTEHYAVMDAQPVVLSEAKVSGRPTDAR